MRSALRSALLRGEQQQRHTGKEDMSDEGTQLAGRVMSEIESEVEDLRTKTRDLQDQLPDLEKAKDDAWEEYAGSGADPDHEDEAAGIKYEHAFKVVMNVHDAIKRNRRKIKELQDPDEFDNRMQQHINAKGGIRRMEASATKPKKQTARDRGVPEEYLNAETGNFKVGMDARYKSDLVNSALDLESKDALMTFTVKDAEKRLEERGWTGFLDRKKEILEEKAAKAKEREEEREQAAREKAEAKEKAAQEKAEAKAAAAEAKAEGEVTPDPKPSSSRGRSRAKA